MSAAGRTMPGGPRPRDAPVPHPRDPTDRMAPMLEELHVAGLGVIDEATLQFAPGSNVLTGETGAGKTMVAVALSLALGGRAGADLVRQGRDAASIEARFVE